MAYNEQMAYQPPNRRYYSSKSSEPQPGPRPGPQSQARRAPPPQQQYNGSSGGYGQRQQTYEGNYQQDYGNNGYDSHATNGYDGHSNGGYENYENGGYRGYDGSDYNDYRDVHNDGYGHEARNNENYSNVYDGLQRNAGYGNMNEQYQQRPPPQQMRNDGSYGQPQPRGPAPQQAPYQQKRQQRSPLHQENQGFSNQSDSTSGALQRPGYGRSQSDGPGERGRQADPSRPKDRRDPRDKSRSRKPMIEPLPETLAWDNPFPTFPMKKKPMKNETDAIEDSMANTSLQPARHSEDLPRPSFASSNRPRPSLDSAERPQNYPNDPRGVNGHGVNNGQRGGLNQPPPIQTQAGYRPRQNPNGHYPNPQEPNSAIEPLISGPIGRSLTSPLEGASEIPRSRQAHVPDKSQAATYHGPDSPGYAPRSYQNFSPPQGGFSAQQARGPNKRPQQFAPEQTYGGHARQDTIEDVYDGYYENRPNNAKSPPFRDREAEIEAEMPNFDDPVGESRRAKAPSDPSVSALPPNHGRPGPDFYQQARSQRSQPDLRSQSRADPRQNHAVGSPEGMPNRDFGGAGSPPSQQNSNVYARPAYAALAQNRGPVPPQIATAPSALPPRQVYTPQSRNIQSPISPPQPGLSRNQTWQSQRSDPGPGHGFSPVEQDPYQRPATSQTGRPSLDERPPNPDALPEHPTPAQQAPPVRPALSHNITGLPQNRPAPVRQYNRVNTAVPTATTQISPSTSSRSSKERRRSAPITPQELDRLRNVAKANSSDQKLRLHYAKKLVEAAAVLSDEGGRADIKTRDKNRERYILEAYKEIKKLASQGYPDAQFYLADCYGQGALGLAVDTKEAFTLYQAAAKSGHAPSAYRTAVCCEMGPEDGGGTRKDPVKAVQWYKRAAALGDVPAMYKVGMILLKGLLGQARNLGDALIWLKRAADRADEENPHALHELGLLYESQMPGQDKIIRDDAYAFELFTRAAAFRYKFSQFRLGQAYEYGLLTCPIDARQSIQWYTKAAAQGEHQSELALSGWYLTGSPGILEQSDTEAYLWARKAATADPVPLPKAMFAMGYFTEVGIGCPRSLEEAKRWYGRAAAYKFPKAQERLEELKKGGPKVQKNRERLSRSNKDRNDAECVIM
ncbi:hypothetical protein EV356DRAFT_360493 [Viridothelium virens]|uniref:HCP-like protein n=1 Tax=Viridothelium virens TaxID=1048519 RepID=A0A6A6HIJ8_VIRVR|nr:hypothetical protein EV356DRAFT_360493 [Viridothelium virens]